MTNLVSRCSVAGELLLAMGLQEDCGFPGVVGLGRLFALVRGEVRSSVFGPDRSISMVAPFWLLIGCCWDVASAGGLIQTSRGGAWGAGGFRTKRSG